MSNNYIQIPQGYKMTSLGFVPQEWEVKRYDKIAPLQRGFDLPIETIVRGNVPVVFSNGILKHHIEAKVSGPGIVTGRSGTIGKVHYIESDFWPHNTTLWVTNFCGNYPKYLYYFIEFIDLTKFVAGSGVPTLNRNDVHVKLFSLPPIAEQERIAEILGCWDKSIELQGQFIEKLELRKRALMQQLLTGRTRLKGFSGAWKDYHLGDMFKERNESKFDYLPLLSVGQDGIYPQSESDKKDTSNLDKSKYKRICVGDIGYNTMRMWQGRSALSSLEGIVSPAYTIVSPKNGCNALFFSYLFKMPKTTNLFWRNSQGLVDDTLNCKFKDFSIVKMALPLHAEQTAIAEILTNADKEVDLARVKLATLCQQKKGLMQQLLTGKTRVRI